MNHSISVPLNYNLKKFRCYGRTIEKHEGYYTITFHDLDYQDYIKLIQGL